MIPINHTVTWTPSLGLDVWGDPKPSEPVELECNVRSETKMVKNQQGQEVVSTLQVLFIGLVSVKYADSFTFVEANGEVLEMTPLNVKFMRDLDGSVEFTKVVF